MLEYSDHERWVEADAVRTVLERLEARERRISKAETAAIAACAAELDGTTGSPNASASELYAQVYARPDDEAARAVLADVLQETGDPRGELIVLQSAEKRGTKREQDLLREHLAKLLGPLAPVVVEKSAVFERGFLVSCGLTCKLQKVANAVIGRPEWATVRSLALFTPGPFGWSPPILPLLEDPSMRSLREVRYLSVHELAKLTKPLPLTTLHVSPSGARTFPAFDHAEPYLPTLTELSCGDEVLRDDSFLPTLLENVLARRMKTLGVDILDEEDKVEWLKLAQRAELEATTITIERSDRQHGWRWMLRRDPRGNLSILEGEHLHQGYRWKPWKALPRAEALIAAMAPSLTAVSLRSNVPLAENEASLAERLDAIRRAARKKTEVSFFLRADARSKPR